MFYSGILSALRSRLRWQLLSSFICSWGKCLVYHIRMLLVLLYWKWKNAGPDILGDRIQGFDYRKKRRKKKRDAHNWNQWLVFILFLIHSNFGELWLLEKFRIIQFLLEFNAGSSSREIQKKNVLCLLLDVKVYTIWCERLLSTIENTFNVHKRD